MHTTGIALKMLFEVLKMHLISEEVQKYNYIKLVNFSISASFFFKFSRLYVFSNLSPFKYI